MLSIPLQPLFFQSLEPVLRQANPGLFQASGAPAPHDGADHPSGKQIVFQEKCRQVSWFQSVPRSEAAWAPGLFQTSRGPRPPRRGGSFESETGMIQACCQFLSNPCFFNLLNRFCVRRTQGCFRQVGPLPPTTGQIIRVGNKSCFKKNAAKSLGFNRFHGLRRPGRQGCFRQAGPPPFRADHSRVKHRSFSALGGSLFPLSDLWRIPLEPSPTPSCPFVVLRAPSWISFFEPLCPWWMPFMESPSVVSGKSRPRPPRRGGSFEGETGLFQEKCRQVYWFQSVPQIAAA